MKSLLSPLALAALAAACFAGESPPWEAEVVLRAPAKLGGCAAGDLLPERPGEELAAVCADGGVHLAWRGDGGWASERIAGLPGEMVQCAVGDALPAVPGLEIVCVGSASGGEDSGGPGAAWVLFREGEAWRSERITTDGALLHGVAVGDLDPAAAGDEVLLVGFTRRALLARRAEEGWRVREVAPLPGPGKNAVIAGGRAIIACADGSLVSLAPSGEGGWSRDVLDRAEAGYARLATDGERILAARDDGALVLVEEGRARVVHRTEGKLRGAVIADLDPRTPGPELATGGYDRRVVLLARGEEGAYRARELFRAEDRLHHLTCVRTPEGPRLAACGYSGRLVVLRPPER